MKTDERESLIGGIGRLGIESRLRVTSFLKNRSPESSDLLKSFDT